MLPCPPPGDHPNPGIEPGSQTLQADSLPSEPPGKPKNTGVGSLSLLQGISLTQESNQGLLHYRQILYQLSYQGKNCSFENKGFISKVMSLVFNRLSRLAIAFLPRSKQLLISWLQSLSAVILEPKKIKSITDSIVSPSIYHEVMGLDAMILVLEY